MFYQVYEEVCIFFSEMIFFRYVGVFKNSFDFFDYFFRCDQGVQAIFPCF